MDRGGAARFEAGQLGHNASSPLYPMALILLETVLCVLLFFLPALGDENFPGQLHVMVLQLPEGRFYQASSLLQFLEGVQAVQLLRQGSRPPPMPQADCPKEAHDKRQVIGAVARDVFRYSSLLFMLDCLAYLLDGPLEKH